MATLGGMADATPGGTDPQQIYAAPAARRRLGLKRGLVLAGVIGFIAVCAIAVLVYLGFGIGLFPLLIGLVAAILPVPVLVACFLWLDRYEPEPIRYLLFCFSWGAFVSTGAALFVNNAASWLFDRWGLPEALVAVLVAPFIEELTKALGPILLLWRRRREWSGITDGIVYCGLSAVGFAMVENILYLGGHGYRANAEQYGPATGAQAVFAIFIVRILFTGFAHPLFTSMTGIGLGISARAGDRRVARLAPIAGLLVAMMLHGTWNLLPTLAAALGNYLILLYGYIGFMVPIFFGMVGFAVGLRAWEGRLSERILPQYVRAGWLSPPEVAAMGSLGRRHSARRWARRVAGDAGLAAMRGFQFAATRLALLRDGIQRGLHVRSSDAARAAAEERLLLTAIGDFRAVYVGRDSQAPDALWNGQNYQITFPDGVRRTVPPPIDPVVPVPVPMESVPMGYRVPVHPPTYPAPTYPASSYPGYGQPSNPRSPAPDPYGAPGGYGHPPPRPPVTPPPPPSDPKGDGNDGWASPSP